MVNGLVHLDVWIHFYLVIPLMSSSVVRQRTPSTIYYYVTCLAKYVELFHTAPMLSRINFWTTCLVGSAFFFMRWSSIDVSIPLVCCAIFLGSSSFLPPLARLSSCGPLLCVFFCMSCVHQCFLLSSVDVSSFRTFQFI